MSPLDASTLNLSSSFSSEWTRASSILSDEESTAQDAKKCRMDSEDDGREKLVQQEHFESTRRFLITFKEADAYLNYWTPQNTHSLARR